MASGADTLERFRGVFFEEAAEAVETMESVLLRLDAGETDEELIHQLFRAAHSTKGGAGTFGYGDVVSFTHDLETLLDDARSHRLTLTGPSISVLLRAVDHLRALLAAARTRGPVPSEQDAEIRAALRALLADAPGATSVAPPPAPAPVATSACWRITFKPSRDLMATGNDPVLMFRALERLGSLTVTTDAAALPPLPELQPEALFLSWTLRLETAAGRAAIDDIFAWVLDDAAITVEPVEVQTVGAETLGAAAEPTGENALPGAVAASNANRGDAGSIRVGIERVDALINMVGELVITQAMLGQIGKEFDLSKLEKLREGLAVLARNTREIQDAAMRIRMLPISFAFNRLPRVVRDLAAQLGKKVEVRMSGENTDLDKTVMEKLSDPLIHLVRNAIDHGIEAPAQRVARGKPEFGTLSLEAYHKGGSIVIEVSDDGAGIDGARVLAKARERGLVGADELLGEAAVHDLLFRPGFSTAAAITNVSGRGVGLDVVRGNIKALGGSVEVLSRPQRGTTFVIRLPLTLAILDGQLVQVADQTFVIPLVSMVESLQMMESRVSSISGRAELYRLRDEYIPVIRLGQLFGIAQERRPLAGGLLVVVETDGHRAGLLVDDLLNQQQVVVKSLENNLGRVEGVSGATILGDGTVSLILDVNGLVTFAQKQKSGGGAAVVGPPTAVQGA